jgi:hypothetical protein
MNTKYIIGLIICAIAGGLAGYFGGIGGGSAVILAQLGAAIIFID